MKNLDSLEWIDNFIDNHRSQLNNNFSEFENNNKIIDRKNVQTKKEFNDNIINQLMLENKQLKELNILKDHQIFLMYQKIKTLENFKKEINILYNKINDLYENSKNFNVILNNINNNNNNNEIIKNTINLDDSLHKLNIIENIINNMFIENKNYKEIFSQINKQTKIKKQNNIINNNKISSRNNKINKINTNKSYDKFILNTSPSYNYFKQKNKNKQNLKNK